MAEKLYQRTKNTLIKKYGREPLDNFQLDSIGRELFGSKYIGTYYHDKLPEMKANKFAIVNTAKYPNEGIHWVAIYTTPNNQYIWDSYSRHPKQLLSKFSGNGKNIVHANPNDVDQKDSDICGILCISWLNAVNKYGIREAIKEI